MERLRLFATALALVSSPESQPASRPADSLRIQNGEQIAAIGDSITQGGGYLRAINAVFDQQYPDLKIPRIINAGISGQKAEDLIGRFRRDVVDRKPDVVTINVGINDVWHRLEAPHEDKVLKAYGNNVEQMVRTALDAGSKVYLLTPTIIEENPESEGNRRLAKYVAAGREIARRNRCEYVDLHDLFLKAVAGRARSCPTTRPAVEHHLTTDGVHMKPLGDVLMAVGVLRALGVGDDKMAATDLGKVFP